MKRVLAIPLALALAVLLVLRLVGSDPGDGVEPVSPEIGAPVGERAAPVGDVPSAAPEVVPAGESLRTEADAGPALAERGERPLATATAVRIDGRVLHRGRLEPARVGVVRFDLVHTSGAREQVEELERLDADELARRITAVGTAQIDHEGRFAVILDADLWVARARIEPRDETLFVGLSTISGAPNPTYIRTVYELRRFAHELDPPLMLEVDMGVTISGRVVDALNGAGVEGASIAVGDRWFEPRDARSDASGRFELSGIETRVLDRFQGSALELSVTHPSYVAERVSVALPVDSTTLSDVQIALAAGVTIEGRVLDSVGRPVPGVVVLASAFGERVTGVGRELVLRELARCDQHGVFRFTALPSTRELAISVLGDSGERLVVDGTSSRADLVLRITPDCKYEVRARSPEGAELGLEGVVVLLLVEDGPAREVRSPFEVGCERSFELALFATPPQALDAGEYWRGRAQVLPVPGSAGTRVLEVELERCPREEPPPHEGRSIGTASSDVPRRAFDLRLLDADTGAPIPAGTEVRIEFEEAMMMTSLESDAGLRLQVGLGARVLELTCQGYEPLRLELESVAPGHGEATLRFEPLAD